MHDPLLSNYFRTMPVLPPEKLKSIITQFETTKSKVLREIATSNKAVDYIYNLCKETILNNEPLSSIICDCDADEETEEDCKELEEEQEGKKSVKQKSVSMKNTKEKVIGHLDNLMRLRDEDSRYDTIYRLKLKTQTLLNVLEFINQTQLKQAYMHARNAMLEANLRLVICVVKKLRNKGIELIDLIQEGNVGLIIALDKYEWPPYRETKFTTMAVRWIWLYAMRAVMNRSKTIRTPIHINNSINKLNKAIETINSRNAQPPKVVELQSINGHMVEVTKIPAVPVYTALPPVQALAEELNWPQEKVINILNQEQQSPYIIHDNNYMEDEDNTSFISSLPDHTNMGEALINKIDLENLRSKLEDALSTLTPRQEKVIRLRYGLYTTPEEEINAEKDMATFKEIGDHCEVSKTCTTQHHIKAIKKLKSKLSHKFLKTYCKQFWDDMDGSPLE